MALNFPGNPTAGEVYTVNGESWQWDGTCWRIAPTPVTYSPVYIGAFPPENPLSGDLWWSSSTGTMCIYYVDTDSSQWVSAFQPSDALTNVSSEQVIAALLDGLPAHADISSAVASGVPTGGLFKITGLSGATAIRAVSSYT
tara:strand:- start:784 stop:1209 length:426 start_codon:yes stop_codon:yes gene_type:complete